MNTPSYDQDLIAVNCKITELRASIKRKREAWAEQRNAQLDIPRHGVDCGVWGRIMPYTAGLCFKKWPEDNDLILLGLKRWELVKLIGEEAKESLPY